MSSNWPTKTLAEVCQIRPPKAEARQRLAQAELVSFVPMEDMGIDQMVLVPTQTKPLAEVAGSYTYFADGDVLLPKITPCFENGKLAIASELTNGIGFGSSEFMVFRPDKSVDKGWLYYFLSRESFRVEGAARMSGAVGHKRVAMEFIDSYPIPIPPLPEQQRIVAILYEAFEGIATAKTNTEKNLQNAREVFESQLDWIFSNPGVGWVEKKLGEICNIARGGSPRPIKAFLTDASNGVNWIKISDATASSKFIYSTAQKIKPSGVSRSRLVQDGDFILSNSMSFGRPYIMKTTGCIHDGWLVLSNYQSSFDPDFLYLLLGSKFIYRQFDQLAAGSTVRNLNIDLASGVVVPIPPLKEQERLAEALGSFDENVQQLSGIYQQKLTALDELKQSLLHRAFNGDL